MLKIVRSSARCTPTFGAKRHLCRLEVGWRERESAEVSGEEL